MAGEKRTQEGTVIRILHLEDNRSDAALIKHILKTSGIKSEILHASDSQQYKAALGGSKFDIILCDYSLPSYDGLEALKECRKRDSDVPFIFISGTIGEERAVESLKQGATDYILKSHPERLTVAIHRALEESKQRKAHREVEEALRRSEQRLRHIAENAKDVIYSFFYGPPARFEYISPAVFNLTGDKPEEFYADPTLVVKRVFPEDLPTIREVLEERKLPDGPTQIRWLNRAGEVMWTEHTMTGIFEEGKLVGFEGIGRDISEAKRSELKIREQAELLDRASDMIFLARTDGQIAYSNRSTRETLGFSEEEAISLSLGKIWGEERKAVQEHLTQVKVEKDWSGELQFKRKNGTSLLFHSRWSLVTRPDGPHSFLVINTDITEKKRLETQLFRAQRLDCLGSLAGGIAHDLNNVLAPILMASSMMRTEEDTANVLKWAETIESSAKRGAELIKQILAFARGTESALGNVDVTRVIKDVQKVLRATLPASIKLGVKTPARLWQIKGNFTEVHQVLMNLCINARDAMPGGGSITIRGDNQRTELGRVVMLEVEDTGVGMSPDVVSRIFEPFFTTKPLGQGTGLGLATVRAIVDKYGGKIAAESQPGKGTLFRLQFPAADSHRDEVAEAGDELAMGRGERLLVVEDEAALREMLKATLSEVGYIVTAASNGLEALTVLKETHEDFDLILTDVSMPVMGGVALSEQVWKANPEQRIVLMSGMLERQAFDEIRGKRKFLLPKPFSTMLLLNEIRQALEAH